MKKNDFSATFLQIVAKIAKNVKLFLFFWQFAHVFRAIEGNFTLFAIFCQVFNAPPL